jgi:hypothetical protein
MSGRSKTKTEGVEELMFFMGKNGDINKHAHAYFLQLEVIFLHQEQVVPRWPFVLLITLHLKEKTNLEQMNHYKENGELRLKSKLMMSMPYNCTEEFLQNRLFL